MERESSGLQGASFEFDRKAVRGAFLEMVKMSAPKGWVFLERLPDSSVFHMQRAVFCVCLPDASHWLELVCMAQAVLSGCIPITFFHHYLHPWLHALPFSSFSLNIDPMDVHETAMRVEVMLMDASLVWRMQSEVQAVQRRFVYSDTAHSSAIDQVMTALENKASMLLYGQPLWNTE